MDFFGVRAWRAKPLRERLMPWPVYLLLALLALAISLYLFIDPSGERDTRVGALHAGPRTGQCWLGCSCETCSSRSLGATDQWSPA